MATRQWRVSRGGHLSATCRRRSRSGFFAPGPRISRLPMRFRVRRVRRVARDGPLQQAGLPSLSERARALSAKRFVGDREHRFRKQRIATPTRLPRWGPGARCGPPHGETGLLKRTIASDATYSVPGNRIASRGTARAERRSSHCVRGRRAIDAVSRVVELVRGSDPASTRGEGRKCANCKTSFSASSNTAGC